ncbi:signal recognition particle-docking protein FtsY [Mitsuokella sp. oral taxon 131 str. W9106]|nr:signal recognition particle-docking protein FtsY [Mitsuokella sp. oral taxon 131 str. W9106]
MKWDRHPRIRGDHAMGFFDKLKKGLDKTRENLTNKIEKLVIGYADIDEDFLEELEEALILADVGIQTTETLMEAVRKGIKKKEIKSPEDLKPFLQKEITAILEKGENTMHTAEAGPTVLLVIGVNGAGKTTTIGKLAAYYRGQGKNVLLAAADTFRAAAIDQLEAWGRRTGVPVIRHDEGSDPAAVAFDAVKAAVARKVDLLLIDTAGRLQTKSNLMQELEKINRVIGREIKGAPHETLLVLDATTGQNAISQAELFTKAAPITGVVLTKLDGTAKGGVVIGIKSQLAIPVKWIGVGESVEDLRPFVAQDFAKALFAG